MGGVWLQSFIACHCSGFPALQSYVHNVGHARNYLGYVTGVVAHVSDFLVHTQKMHEAVMLVLVLFAVGTLNAAGLNVAVRFIDNPSSLQHLLSWIFYSFVVQLKGTIK